jgi:hypothetical protein
MSNCAKWCGSVGTYTQCFLLAHLVRTSQAYTKFSYAVRNFHRGKQYTPGIAYIFVTMAYDHTSPTLHLDQSHCMARDMRTLDQAKYPITECFHQSPDNTKTKGRLALELECKWILILNFRCSW